MNIKGINYIYILSFLLVSLTQLQAQMNIDGDIFYGNEWIESDENYYKVEVAYDGLFRITYDDMISAGINGSEISGSNLALIHLGNPIPIYVSTDGPFSQDDYILFEGKKNRAFLDQFLIEGGMENLLNEYYSMTSDISTYYISLSGTHKNFINELENDIDGASTPKSYAVHEDTIINSSHFHKPYFKISNLSTYQSHYMRGEGFSSGITTTSRLNFRPKNYLENTGHEVQLSVKVSSEYKSFSETQNMEIVFNENQLVEEEYNSFEMKNYNFNIPPSYLNKGTEKVEVRGLVDRFDRYTVPYAFLSYPRVTSAVGGKYFQDVKSDSLYYEITEFSTDEAAWLFSGNHIMKTIVEEGVHKIQVDSRIEDRFKIYDKSAIKNLSVKAAHTFIDFSEVHNSELIFITSDELKSTVPSIKEYLDYRTSDAGGAYDATIVTVEELYETFGYGVSDHQMSIKNFIAYATSQHKLSHVFFIGKGLQYHEIRTEKDRQEDGKHEYQIPAFGFPSSDNLFASPVDRLEQYASIGRLAYNTENEINQYLNKVITDESKEYSESVKNELWRNRLIHLNGGGGGEHQAIDAAFNRIESELDDLPFTPEIYEYIKTSQSSIAYENLEEIIEQVNKGALIFNFFGHASSSGFNIDINRPKQYHNEHLPLLIGLGCSAGNYNTVGETIGEIYCGYAKGGFIGVLATTHYSTIGDLGVMGEKLYEQFFETEGKTYGEMFKDAMNDVAERGLRRGAEQIMYMGDPCLKLQVPKGVDIGIEKESVSTLPFQLNTQLDSIKLNFDLVNLGLMPDKPVSLKIEQHKPDGIIVNLIEEDVSVERFRNSFSYSFPIDSSMAGSNFFNIIINENKSILELPDPQAYRNNSLKSIFNSKGFEVFISDYDINISYPSEYSIVPSQDVELMVYGSPVIDTGYDVFFEIDTTALFNSQLKKKSKEVFYGGELSVNPEIDFIDSTVYYWRSGYISNNDTTWKTSSFIYIPEKTGWNQSHYFQFLGNEFNGLKLEEDRIFKSDEYIRAVLIYNSLYSNLKGLRYNVNGQNFNQPNFWMPRFTGAYVVAHYPGRFNWFYSPAGGHFGSYNPYSRAQRTTAFSVDSIGGRIDLVNFIENQLDDDMYVAVLFSVYQSEDSLNIEEWAADSIVNDGKNIFNVLEKYGATKVRKLQTNIDAPYGFFFTKNGAIFDEQIGDSEEDQISIIGNLPYPNIDGSLYTPLIDKAISYRSFDFRFKNMEESDTNFVQLINMTIPEIIFSDIRSQENSIDISDVPDSTVTRMTLNLKDSINFSMPQLDFWRLYYDPIPDYALGSTKSLSRNYNRVDNNTVIPLEFKIFNISHDVLENIDYSITILNDKNEIVLDTQLVLTVGIDPYKSTLVSFPYSISTNSSFLEFRIELNKNREIAEETYENNILIKRIGIDQDIFKPNLSVFFDGEVIEDRSYVASDVLISILLEDIREVPLLQDTSLIEFELYDPEGMKMKSYHYGSDRVRFVPGNESGKNAEVIISGNFQEEGVYKLTVHARDNNNNESGNLKYYISFEINEVNAISRVINIPNPATDYTHFAYEMKGRYAPESYKIYVVDATGKLIRTLSENDLGPLKIGAHRTDSGWDTRTEGGDLLPSGVYFYKLEILDADKKFQHLKTKYDNVSADNWGKMMIFRNY